MNQNDVASVFMLAKEFQIFLKSGSRHQLGFLNKVGKRDLEEVGALLILLHGAAAHGSIRRSIQIVLEYSMAPQVQDTKCMTIPSSLLR